MAAGAGASNIGVRVTAVEKESISFVVSNVDLRCARGSGSGSECSHEHGWLVLVRLLITLAMQRGERSAPRVYFRSAHDGY
jgi:hypothetical protein